MAPFPLIKLGIVFFKQVSKPLANQIKIRAKNSEFFKSQVSSVTMFVCGSLRCPRSCSLSRLDLCACGPVLSLV